MSRKGLRLHISVPTDIYKDVKKRTTFCASTFFQKKYTEEFLSERALKSKLRLRMDEVKDLQERLAATTDSKIISPPLRPDRCPICTMFYNEDISIRHKKQIYKGFYFLINFEIDTNDLSKLNQKLKFPSFILA